MRDLRIFSVFGGFFASVLLLAAGAVSAESYAYDLAGELMSPYCPGRTVSSCPSPQASELIQWIQVQEAGGASKEEVVEMLIERFGEEILGAPPAEGITLWAYILPVGGFVVGGGIAVVVLRRVVGGGTKNGEGTPAPPMDSSSSESSSAVASTDDELSRQVEAELAARS